MVFQVNGGVAESGMQDPTAPTIGIAEAEGRAKTHLHIIWEWNRFPRYFLSGKSKRFVLHCSLPHETDPHYLTPTQRAVREVKHLKAQMKLADGRLQLKQEELLRVTSELVELKLRFSALQELTCESCGAKIAIPPNLRLDGTKRRKKVRSIPSSYSSGSQDSLDGASVTLRADKPTSLTDSGQFEENSSAKSLRMAPDRTSVDAGILTVECREEYHELKAKYNDRIEELLSQLSLLNRSYGDLRGRYEAAECRLHGLEEERRALVREKEAGENRHGRIYMQAFQQGRETARAERKSELDDLRLQKMPELLKGLKLEESQVDSMQALKHQTACQETVVKGKEGFDPGVTLQFLKSAIFYFITDPENQEGHLKAIESILGYNETEKRKMNKAVKSWWR
ncbi:unnamed protein product [Darwinula stevensoni]|uniref:GRIP domain-containing protein n=1 Tax=Darwinula stevensoni TaxID=69355 RepID=A0A7R9AA96_9CRUS|nr:unnamed protein product [Darwinula stevensoni]CAG0898221.1 unnamed protein product [Darwinula stevensoni]